MHDCLRLHNISRLVPSLRRVATAAASGSVDDLHTLYGEIERLPRNQAILCLPAIYANLDPTGIPHVDDAKAEDIERGRASLQGLYSSQSFIPAQAFHDLWPRYWSWFQFLHLYAGTVRDHEEEHRLCQNFLMFVAMSHAPAISRLVGETAGVRNVIARAWWLLVQTESSIARDAGFDCLDTCILSMDASEPAGLEEYVDGAGGEIDGLASLVARTISELVPTRSAPVSAQTMKFLRGILQFIITTDHVHDRERKADSQVLSIALGDNGFVRVLTTAIDNFADGTVPAANHALHHSFTLLGMSFNAHLGHLCIAEALKSGLLHALLRCSSQPPANTVHTHLKFFLTTRLPMTLMYHSVVREIENALLDIQDIVHMSSLARTEMWHDFIDLAMERVGILKTLDAPDAFWPAACDNMECGVIGDRPSFKRCSNCKSAYYCSTRCQISDWQHGGHRRICAPDLMLPLAEQRGLTRRDRAFIRAVLQHDYEKEKADNIYPSQVMFMHQFPREGFFTDFDYTWGRPNIEIRSVVQSHEAKQFRKFLGAEWITAVSRALRSEGRMELHLLHLMDSAVPRYWLIPLRTNTTGLHARMKSIANSLARGVGEAHMQEIFPSVLDEVQGAIDEEEKAGLQAIH